MLQAADNVGSETCGQCHEQVYEQWRASDHFMAMQPAESETVRGDFNDISIAFHGENYVLSRDKEGYYATFSACSRPPAISTRYC